MKTVGWIVFSFFALALLMGGMDSDQERCKAKGGSIGGFNFPFAWTCSK